MDNFNLEEAHAKACRSTFVVAGGDWLRVDYVNPDLDSFEDDDDGCIRCTFESDGDNNVSVLLAEIEEFWELTKIES